MEQLLIKHITNEQGQLQIFILKEGESANIAEMVNKAMEIDATTCNMILGAAACYIVKHKIDITALMNQAQIIFRSINKNKQQ